MKIAIFKSVESGSFEKYNKVFADNNVEALLIPSIDFIFTNIAVLCQKLQKPELYGGLIFTSPRSVQAAKLCNKSLVDWTLKQNFSIGETTHSEALSQLGLETFGKESGNAQSLGENIIEMFVLKNPLLFPCGNLAQDSLQKQLKRANIETDIVEVYETVQHPELESNFMKALDSLEVEFFVFFSPSIVNFCHAIAEKCDRVNDFTKKKLISIGPSTSRALEVKKLQIYATASSPSPEGLLVALMSL